MRAGGPRWSTAFIVWEAVLPTRPSSQKPGRKAMGTRTEHVGSTCGSKECSRIQALEEFQNQVQSMWRTVVQEGTELPDQAWAR